MNKALPISSGFELVFLASVLVSFPLLPILLCDNSISYIFQVCRVWLDQIEHCHVDTGFMHTLCGQLIDKKAPSGDPECKFCHRICNGEVERTFHLKITLADDTAKVFAWCIGQTAAELLQISPNEFYELPEVSRNPPKNLPLKITVTNSADEAKRGL